MSDRHCFHDRWLVTLAGTILYRQCCNCDRTPGQCAATTCDDPKRARRALAAERCLTARDGWA